MNKTLHILSLNANPSAHPVFFFHSRPPFRRFFFISFHLHYSIIPKTTDSLNKASLFHKIIFFRPFFLSYLISQNNNRIDSPSSVSPFGPALHITTVWTIHTVRVFHHILTGGFVILSYIHINGIFKKSDFGNFHDQPVFLRCREKRKRILEWIKVVCCKLKYGYVCKTEQKQAPSFDRLFI